MSGESFKPRSASKLRQACKVMRDQIEGNKAEPDAINKLGNPKQHCDNLDSSFKTSADMQLK